jgi:hypothetical protein
MTAWPVTWPARPGACCSPCAPGAASLMRCARQATASRTSSGQLSQLRPGDAVLSEEGRDDLARLAADRVWIVDPLDGTKEFGEPGRTDWAVHVALWERGQLVAGAVALPAQDTVLSTAEPPPAPPAMTPGRPVRVLVSRTRPPALLDGLAKEIELTLIPMGSAGAAGPLMPTCTAAASTSGIRRRRWRSPRRRGCTRRGWTGQSWPTTSRILSCRIFLSAQRDSPPCCWMDCAWLDVELRSNAPTGRLT